MTTGAPVQAGSYSADFAERFWSKVDKSSGPDACWPWTACRLPAGYGRVRVPTMRRMRLAHVTAFELSGRVVPAGLFVLHGCDNPPCCNPQHLRAGTRADNTRDRLERGRGTRGRRVPTAKLTDDVVRQVREIYAAGGCFQRDLAVTFGVNQQQISRIVRGVHWKHVNAEAS